VSVFLLVKSNNVKHNTKNAGYRKHIARPRAQSITTDE